MQSKEMKLLLEYYFKQQTKIHLKFINQRFYNGIILDLTSDKDLMVFNDDKLGTVPVLFEEIERVEPCMEKGK